jgi:hypothetical protein
MTGGTFGLRSFILLPMTIGSRQQQRRQHRHGIVGRTLSIRPLVDECPVLRLSVIRQLLAAGRCGPRAASVRLKQREFFFQ